MPSTSKKVPSTSKKDKKQRNHLTIQEKLEIIELRNNGASFAKIARDKGMNESSIRTIYEKREKTAQIGIKTADYNVKIPMIRDKTHAKLEMEELLFIWVEDCAKRYAENYNMIMRKDLI